MIVRLQYGRSASIEIFASERRITRFFAGRKVTGDLNLEIPIFIEFLSPKADISAIYYTSSELS